jgi:hypothetical protein
LRRADNADRVGQREMASRVRIEQDHPIGIARPPWAPFATADKITLNWHKGLSALIGAYDMGIPGRGSGMRQKRRLIRVVFCLPGADAGVA